MIIWLIASALSVALLPFLANADEISKDIQFDDEDVGSEESNELHFNSRDQGWSEWSAWSSCSRSCNGGVSYQIRKCERKSGCEGESTKYKICNMQACPDSQDFRAGNYMRSAYIGSVPRSPVRVASLSGS
ncbi:ADAMTS-like protein 3 like protein [Argiope bruennichi]|uniref:ADAMTS-like protein 3 like protein n=1 Tax=Argiope bruennichi TaxID=94029 RepID=A0A8T0G1I3_ARGBR|nr:ADAMTS-like protein 3 like protein [Argiope bruennichi]